MSKNCRAAVLSGCGVYANIRKIIVLLTVFLPYKLRGHAERAGNWHIICMPKRTMMMKYLPLSTILSICVVCAACGRSETLYCPAFSDTAMFDWFPYNQHGAEYTFSDSNGNQEILQVKDITLSQYHNVQVEYTWTGAKVGGDTPKEQNECNIYGSVYVASANSQRVIMLGHDVATTNGMRTYKDVMSISVANFSINFEWQNDNGFAPVAREEVYSLTKLESLSGNGFEYKNVHVGTVIDTGRMNEYKYRADKIYFVKGTGVVGYRSYPDGIEYWLE